ncbi:hypothetical protein MXY30_003697, partial [Serratia marcescens]
LSTPSLGPSPTTPPLNVPSCPLVANETSNAIAIVPKNETFPSLALPYPKENDRTATGCKKKIFKFKGKVFADS